MFETNKYSVPPGYARQPLTVRARVGEPHLRIVTATGIKVATHRRAPNGAEQTIRSSRARRPAGAGRAGRVHHPDRLPIARSTGRPANESLAELAKLHGHARTRSRRSCR